MILLCVFPDCLTGLNGHRKCVFPLKRHVPVCTSVCQQLIKVHLSFLQVGHTHEDIDAQFSQLAGKLRRNEAETIPNFLMLLNSAHQVQGLYDIKKWLSPYLNNIKHHSKPLHFRFRNNDAECIFEYRSRSTSSWFKLNEGILSGLPTGEPEILLPQNMQKIDTSLIKENIEKHRYDMTGGEGQYQWWIRFLENIEEAKGNAENLKKYSARGAFCVFPELVSKQSQDGNTKYDHVDIQHHLAELLDKELDDHEVIVSKAKKRTPKK